MVAGAMRTPDGIWRVEVVIGRNGGRLQVRRWGCLIGDCVTLPDLEALLVRLGVDLAELVEV